MRFLIDMNLTPRWAPSLRDAGYEASHWSSIGSPSAPESEICTYAREHDCVLVTNDLDFPRILAHTRDAKPSIVLLRGEPLVPELRGDALLSAVQNHEVELRAGAIVMLDWSGPPRARVLPLR